MLKLKYFLSLMYLLLLYKRARSGRRFVNWLFDYLIEEGQSSFVKVDGVMFLLLSFEEDNDYESFEVCCNRFGNEILKTKRLSRIKNRCFY